MLQGKKILLGVCGSIAAYKSAILVRLLVKQGAEVKVIQTEAAKAFISPLTLSTLSKHPVLSDFVRDKTGTWNNHVDLGLWADLMVIAPASANTLAKMSAGICDNLLLATYLSAKCPVMFAPAMDRDMYLHQSTVTNIKKLHAYGNILLKSDFGELASGLEGEGRMMEPEAIVQEVASYFSTEQKLVGKRILITSGPTHEALDPVRFIGNHSTGKMGLALAEEAAKRGAEVTLVTGPIGKIAPHQHISIWNVKSAAEMYEATAEEFPKVDIAIFAAAVSDYRPSEVSPQKIKKESNELTLKLVKNKDIALEMGKLKQPHQLTVGFALETEQEEQNALNKLARKNLDFIVLNSLKDEGAGFSHDTNRVSIFSRDNKRTNFELKHKKEVASDILDFLEGMIK